MYLTKKNKFFLIIVIFTFLIAFFFSTSSKSASIYDLDIEGITLDENIEKYISKDNLKQQLNYFKINKGSRYPTVKYLDYKKKLYDSIWFAFNKENNKIGNIRGLYNLETESKSKCLGRAISIADEIEIKLGSKMTVNELKKNKWRINRNDKMYKKIYSAAAMVFDDGYLTVSCYYYEKKPENSSYSTSIVQVEIQNRDFMNWTANEKGK